MSATMVVTRTEVARLLTIDACIAAVEAAFASAATGASIPSAVLGFPTVEGGFHMKTAGLRLDRLFVATKVNGNFPRNRELRGLPTIQGVIMLADGETGEVLALMDSIEITAQRTAAASAVAAKYLAPANASSIGVCGCGLQGAQQLRAIATVRRLTRARVYDTDATRAQALARDAAATLGFAVEIAASAQDAMRGADIVVTCTPSRAPFVRRDDLAPGAFVAAVGADSHDKQELHPDVMATSTVVVDSTEQCATIGDLHHAIAAGVMTRERVHAELADIVGGRRAGRSRDDEIIIFDSTGIALEDVAAAVAVYRGAKAQHVGIEVQLG